MTTDWTTLQGETTISQTQPKVDSPWERLLVYRSGQLGDTIVGLPSLWALRKQYPGKLIVLLSEVQRQSHISAKQVLPKEGLVDAYEAYPCGVSWHNLFGLGRTALAIRKRGYKVCAYLVTTIRTPAHRRRDAFFFRLAGVRCLLGCNGFPEDPFPRLATGLPAPVLHEADALLHRLSQDGIAVAPPGQGCMDLRITPSERKRALAWWQEHDGQGLAQGQWFAVGPGGKWASKKWPMNRYAELGQLLISRYRLTPVVFGGGDDRKVGEELISAWGLGLCAAGALEVRESAALLRDALFYVGNDNGTMHLAAAMNRPCVAIFSAQDWPGRWQPYGNSHTVLRAQVHCSGCRCPVCPRDLECLKEISVSDMLEACQRTVPLLRGTGRGGD